MSAFILGIDFGGTKNAVALFESDSNSWLDFRRRISAPNANAQSDLAAVLEMSRELLAHHTGELLSVGVSFGGPVDYENGTVRLSYHVPGWEVFPLRNQLQKEFGVPVCMENDANAGAFGEYYFGAGSTCKSLFYITVSTGIGGGWVLNGNLYRGANGLAGEIGHVVVNADGPACACGKKGCLEALASGTAISRQAVERMKIDNRAGSILRRLCKNNPEMVTAEMVSQAANSGDELAKAVLLEAAGILGKGIGQVLLLMNPERIVLGGGVSKAGKMYWDEVCRSASEYCLPGISLEVVPAILGDDAPLWGAIALAIHLVRKKSERIDDHNRR